MAGPRQLVAAFGRFVWEFLIGDNPIAFVCAVVVVTSALLFRHHHLVVIIALPLIVIVFLVFGAYRSRMRSSP